MADITLPVPGESPNWGTKLNTAILRINNELEVFGVRIDGFTVDIQALTLQVTQFDTRLSDLEDNLEDTVRQIAADVIASDPTLIAAAEEALAQAIPGMGIVTAGESRFGVSTLQVAMLKDMYPANNTYPANDIYPELTRRPATSVDFATLVNGKLDPSVIPTPSSRHETLQQFDGGIGFGDVEMKFIAGHGGARVTLQGQAGDVPAPMPYFDVYASTAYPNYSQGDDVGSAVGGYQLHVDGKAGEPDRSYWYVEAHKTERPATADFSNHPDTNGYVGIGTAKRGTARMRAIAMSVAAQRVMLFNVDGHVYQGRRTENRTLMPDTPMPTLKPVPERWQSLGSGIRPQIVSWAETETETEGYPALRFARHHSDALEEAPPLQGDTIGAIEAGSHVNQFNDVTPSAGIRMRAAEDWTNGSAHGSATEVQYTPTGSTTPEVGARIEQPTTDATGLLVRVNRGGVETLSRVEVGPADSAGTGYRTLRIPN